MTSPSSKKDHKNQRRKPKQARALAKYNAVLDACTRVSAEQGYQKLTITELSLESDLPISTIYQYFESKDDIFIAWVERLIDQTVTQLTYERNQLETDQLDQYVETLIKTTLTLISHYKVNLQELFTSMPHILISRLIDIMENRATLLIYELFGQQIKKIQHPDIDYKLGILSRMICGYLIQTVHNQKEIDIEKDSRELSFLIIIYFKESGIITPTAAENDAIQKPVKF